MSSIYFFRHGQAGSREHYDRLSELGLRQAAALGQYVAAEGLSFDAAVVGGLRRQQETADAVLSALTAAGRAPRRVERDERWNEFDLDAVFAGIAPQIAAEDARFRAETEEIRRLVASGDGHIHRRWTQSDSQVIEAWIAGRYGFEGESWLQFTSRVREAGLSLRELPDDSRVAVFTSATPTGLWVTAALGVTDQPMQVMKLAATSLNSNISVVHWRAGELYLGCYNSTPHLSDPALRTLR